MALKRLIDPQPRCPPSPDTDFCPIIAQQPRVLKVNDTVATLAFDVHFHAGGKETIGPRNQGPLPPLLFDISMGAGAAWYFLD